jgi:hypothetical protein
LKKLKYMQPFITYLQLSSSYLTTSNPSYSIVVEETDILNFKTN